MDHDSWMWAWNAHTKHKSNSRDVNVSLMAIYRLLLSNNMHKLMTTINAQINNNNWCTSWWQSLQKLTHNKHIIGIWECQLLKSKFKKNTFKKKQQHCPMFYSMNNSIDLCLLNIELMSKSNKIANFNQIIWTLNNEDSGLRWDI